MYSSLDSTIKVHLNIWLIIFLIIVGVFFSVQEVFFRTDVSRTGTLSLRELRNAFLTSGKPDKDSFIPFFIILIVVMPLSREVGAQHEDKKAVPFPVPKPQSEALRFNDSKLFICWGTNKRASNKILYLLKKETY